jgi:hypothetical protein
MASGVSALEHGVLSPDHAYGAFELFLYLGRVILTDKLILRTLRRLLLRNLIVRSLNYRLLDSWIWSYPPLRVTKDDSS